MDRMTGKGTMIASTGQPQKDSHRIVRLGQPEQDSLNLTTIVERHSQNGTARRGQPEQYRQNRTGKAGKAKRYTQHWTNRK
jgi:hypothetical protein